MYIVDGNFFNGIIWSIIIPKLFETGCSKVEQVVPQGVRNISIILGALQSHPNEDARDASEWSSFSFLYKIESNRLDLFINY